MRDEIRKRTLLLLLVGAAAVVAYACGKDDDSSSEGASDEQIKQGAVGYGAFINLMDFSSNLIVANQQALRGAMHLAVGEMRHMQEQGTNYCAAFKKDFCEAKTSSRAGLWTECETSCEDGKTPMTACTFSENIASTCAGEDDKDITVTVRRDSTIEVTSSCVEKDDKYFLDSDIKFSALLSGKSFEGVVKLECTFVQRNALPTGAVEKSGYENCADFSCKIDGKDISCDQFQPVVEKAPCTL